MELLEGETLARRIQRIGRLPVDQLADICRQIASVLEATHAAGITHRDLKPDNIFIVPDAELASGERVKVLDFGIAKLTDGSLNITGTSNAMGTPAYMSPEQWRSSGKVDGRADVYSLGCVAFELATGRPPFLCESIGDACDKHLNTMPPPARSLVPDLSPVLDTLLLHLLAKQPDQRPSIKEAKAAFASFSGPSPSFTAMPSAQLGAATGSSPAIVPPATLTTLGGSAGAVTTPPAAAKNRGVVYALAALGVVAAAAVTIAVVHGGGAAPASGETASSGSAVAPQPGAQPAAGAATPVKPATDANIVHLHIVPTPSTAEVKIDGATVDNPADIPLERSEADHVLEVSAPGFASDRRMVSLAAEKTVTVALKPTSAATGPVATVPAHGPITHPVTTQATTPSTTATVVTTQPATTTTTTPATTTTPSTTDDGKKQYKGTKGTIITDYPGGGSGK